MTDADAISPDDKNPDDSFPIHVRTLTGLEKGLAKELEFLGAREIQIEKRVVICRGNMALLYDANLWCRAAIRVLRPLAFFPAPDEKSFYEGIKKIDWSPWMRPDGSLVIDAHVYSSFSTHSLFVAQLTKDAIVDQFREKTGNRPSVDRDRPDLRIAVSLYQNSAQIHVDSSGESLHKRGYRLKAGEAPISETLAAGVLQITGWDGTRPLVDPMCGSGTFLVEAALIAKNIAPGILSERQFGFQRWQDYDPVLYEKLVREAKAAVRGEGGPGEPNEINSAISILGFEIDPAIAAIARENVKRAGLSGAINIECADFFKRGNDLPPGTLVMNPPYDMRLAVDNSAEFYQRIGDRLREEYRNWTAFVFSGNAQSTKHVGLRVARRTALYNSSIECELLEYDLHGEAQAETRPRIREAEQNPKWTSRAEVFSNRLKKNFKHLSKWARREGVTCWRLYDWEIPELPFVLDIFGDRLHFAEVPRNIEHSPLEHNLYMQLMVKTATTTLGFDPANVYLKVRKPKKTGGAAVSPSGKNQERNFFEVREAGHRLLVNLADFVDAGLFLEHRKTRAWIAKSSAEKDFLNLYSYTGAFSVFAAAGGAKSTTTVDSARSYLDWAKKNLELNNFSGERHQIVRADAVEFLRRTKKKFDLCVVDPPLRSLNRETGETFEVQKDHAALLNAVIEKTRPGGKIFFLTGLHALKLNEAAVTRGQSIRINEVTPQTVPIDFERKPGYRCWSLEVE